MFSIFEFEYSLTVNTNFRKTKCSIHHYRGQIRISDLKKSPVESKTRTYHGGTGRGGASSEADGGAEAGRGEAERGGSGWDGGG